MNNKRLLLTIILILGFVTPLFAAQGKSGVLNDEQKYRVRYAIMLIDEYDYDHAAMVIEPLLTEVNDYDAVQDLYYAHRGLLIGSYEHVVRARFLLLGLLD